MFPCPIEDEAPFLQLPCGADTMSPSLLPVSPISGGPKFWGKQEEDGLDHQGVTTGTAMQKQTVNTPRNVHELLSFQPTQMQLFKALTRDF